MTRMLRRFLRRDRGSVIIEFALVVPLFFIMLSGIIAFSRAYSRLNALNSALREGARKGASLALAAQHRDSVTKVVYAYSTAYGFPIDTASATLSVTFGGNDVVVGVTNYSLFNGITGFWGMNNVRVTRSAIFRWEYAP